MPTIRDPTIISSDFIESTSRMEFAVPIKKFAHNTTNHHLGVESSSHFRIFKSGEIITGDCLGISKFSYVRQASILTSNNSISLDAENKIDAFILCPTTCIFQCMKKNELKKKSSAIVRSNSKDTSHKYAIKTLRPKLTKNPKLFLTHALDLKREGQILNFLNKNYKHKNIISIHGMSQRTNEQNEQNTNIVDLTVLGKPESHFLVLERLDDDTLKDKLSLWRKHSGFYKSIRKPIISERCQILLDLADAIEYIHSHRIIHRDLKPSNIGFQNGVLKLIDFGVARSFPTSSPSAPLTARRKQQQQQQVLNKEENENLKERTEEQLFRMTGMIGTKRYMSPECSQGNPYNSKTDVYSFGLLCYEVLTLIKPYSHIPFDDIPDRVSNFGERLNLEGGQSSGQWFQWPDDLKKILESMWHIDISERPSMTENKLLLKEGLPLLWHRRLFPPLGRKLRKTNSKFWKRLQLGSKNVHPLEH